MGEGGPIAPWRLLFLIEGFPSVVVATIAWCVIPDSPETTWYLTDREKKVARLRLRHERPIRRRRRKDSPAGAGSRLRTPSAAGDRRPLRSRDVLSVFLDPKAWITAAMLFLANMAYSSLPVFLPTMLREMGYTALEAQGLAAPPYLLAFAAVLVTARVSDRARSRAPFVAGHAALSAGGYAVLALARWDPEMGTGPAAWTARLRYAAVYPAAAGFFSVVVLVIAWSVNNQPSESRRGGGFALLQLVGQCGPLLGTRLYPARHAPYFAPGNWACCAAMLGVAALALLLRFYLARANRRLEGQEAAAADGAAAAAAAGVNEEDIEDEEAQGLVSGYSRAAAAAAAAASGGDGEGERGFRYML